MRCLPSRNDQIERKENPGEVHGFELGAKPEVDDYVLVHLTPHVEDA